jgi:hypothetical protein
LALKNGLTIGKWLNKLEPDSGGVGGP